MNRMQTTDGGDIGCCQQSNIVNYFKADIKIIIQFIVEICI